MENNRPAQAVIDPRRARLLRTLSILCGIGIALALLCASEAGAIWYLRRNSLPTYPFLINYTPDRGPKAVSPMFAETLYSAYDPILGYADNPAATTLDYNSQPGFTIYGKGKDANQSLVIVTLGGSTTDGNVPNIWVQALQEMMAAEGINVEVYNGGVAGYSSSQELFKLIRDVIPLKPDLIISYNGVNDLGLGDAVYKHPMVNNYQESIMNYLVQEPPPLVLPNTIKVIQSMPWYANNKRNKSAVNYGTIVNIPPEKTWYRNVRMMHAVAGEFNIPYVVVLQPALGVGKYGELNTSEKQMFTNAQGYQAEGYKTLLNAFYKAAQLDCKKLDYCENLVDVFAGQTGIYVDKMHVNDEGNRLVAGAIFDALLRRFPALKSNLLLE